MSNQETIEQQALRESARRFISSRCGPATSKRVQQDPVKEHQNLWPEIASLGWTGIWIDEAYEGVKSDFVTLALLIEEMGRGSFASPFFESAVTVPMLLDALGTEAARQRILPGIASGEIVATVAVGEEVCTELNAGFSATRASRSGDGFVLNGEKSSIPFAQVADVLLIVAKMDLAESNEPGQLGLFAIPVTHPGVEMQQLIDMSGPTVSNVRFVSVDLPASALVSDGLFYEKKLNAVLLKAAVAKCCEMIGGASFALETIVSYARERKQFGKAIGSFQAIQHHCTNVLVHVETARRLVNEAIKSIDDGNFSSIRGAVAKAWCNFAYREVVRISHQVMGGMGYIDEHVMPWIFRHARAAEVRLGDQTSLLDLIAFDLYANEDHSLEHCEPGN